MLYDFWSESEIKITFIEGFYICILLASPDKIKEAKHCSNTLLKLF